MFTGLIEERSIVLDIGPRSAEGFKIRLAKPTTFDDLKTGESIAVDGVCLTLTHFDSDSMEFFVGAESLTKTNFSQVKKDHFANLERSLAFGDRIGGHLVSGHVDGVGQVLSAKEDDQCLNLEVKLKPEQFKYVIPKGSISINGVSLTANRVSREDKTIGLYLIPETLSRTNLGQLKAGFLVNIECDQYVKIVTHQLENYKEATKNA